ncbi:uncharacterized deoxyribonuclease [[Candida] railenensis]|uniref:Uncharacterized deoxyribonuclease n=1 Tax=[Candida] railenensis TaxID=45579 RepID=A0A9P0VXI4_9ASCO|nr:uncharacterized deoxyribonuclease [[Candida] railenensis]
MSLEGLTDSHCHLDTSCTLERGLEVSEMLSRAADEGPRSHALRHFAVMSTNHLDVDIIDAMSKRVQSSGVVFPFFGVHPWYSHLFASVEPGVEESTESYKVRHYRTVLYPAPTQELIDALPAPVLWRDHLKKLRSLLAEYGGGSGASARGCVGVGVGEIGLDKPFRIPVNGFYGNVEQPIAEDIPNKLSPCRVKLDHQVELLAGQLELAQEFSLPVSLHCVKAHGVLFEVCHRFALKSTVLHSYSGSLDQAKLWLKSGSAEQQVFFSLSNWINGAEEKAEAFTQLVRSLSDSNVLIETDIGIDRRLSECYVHLEGIFTKICEARDWNEERARNVLRENWDRCIRAT